jgi:tetratricopeptide (TPR) repeat protein
MTTLATLALGLTLGGQTPEVPLYDGMGNYHRATSTKVPLAAKFLDQGFCFYYGFQMDVAEKSFREAARLDPEMVMAYWGIAAANGNYINSWAIDKESSEQAIEALNKAVALKAKGTEVENDLIAAELTRFDKTGPAKRDNLDKAFADAMRAVWKKHPKDADVGAVCAESIMQLSPWDYWTPDGKPKANTQEILDVIKAALKLNSSHPQALHLYIHATEASLEPEIAVDQARKLATLQPGLYHMLHMPSHTFNQAGLWKETIDANTRSIAVYKRLLWNRGDTLDYPHARHALAYAAAMRGQSDLALQHASQILTGMRPGFAEANGGYADYTHANRIMFLVRFGKWKDILALPEPPTSQKFSRAMLFEAKGVAYAATKEHAKALEMQVEFKKAIETASHKDLLGVASHQLAGEILFQSGKHDEGIEELRKAVEAEDNLEYSEPPEWIQPMRHTLGAALVEAKRYDEAIKVYNEDLRRHPNNGWSLQGLARAYEGLGKTKDSAKYSAEFKLAWAEADVATTSSCMCLPKK